MKLKFNTYGNEKQKEAVKAWLDPKISRVLYGGTKGCGKSYLGINLIFGDAFIYPGTHYFIARKQLNDLRKHTIPSIFEVFKSWNLSEKYWKFNGQDNFYTLYNDSRVYLLSADYEPSDPDFERFGSNQYTRGWFEEAGQLPAAAVNNLIASTGRWKNDEYNLPVKTLETFNPSKNYLYSLRKQWEKGTLPEHIIYIRAFLKDNKMLGQEYWENLERTLSDSQKQRLMYDNWDYDDDPKLLINSQAINDLFTNDFIEPNNLKRLGFSVKNYGVADLAMQGRDNFLAIPANIFSSQVSNEDGSFEQKNYVLVNFKEGIDKPKATGKEIETDFKNLLIKFNIPRSQAIADSDGLGAYLESYLEGIVAFHGQSKPVNSNEFENSKSELAWKLAEIINTSSMKIIATEEQKERIIRELGVLKAVSISYDEIKKRIISKDKSNNGNAETMKGLLGHSPDYLDILIMLMYFLVNKTNVSLFDAV